MKTSVEISDALLAKVKCVARKRGMTFRQTIEAALSRYLEEPEGGSPQWNHKPFRGDGLVEGIDPNDWGMIRAISYGLEPHDRP